MINVVLVCAGGMSTSFMVTKMQKATKQHEIDANIIPMGADEFIYEEFETDILLIAPQLIWRYEELKDEFQDRIPVIHNISKEDYGMMDGEKVLLDAMSQYKKVKTEKGD